MDNLSEPIDAPPGWLVESLTRSEAQIAAGQPVPGDGIRQRLRDSIARLEAKQAAEGQHGANAHR